MAEVIKMRFLIRSRTAAEWTAINEVLLESVDGTGARELGVEEDTGKMKLGRTGINWNDLDYLDRGGGGIPYTIGMGSGDAMTAVFSTAPAMVDGTLVNVRAPSANTLGIPTFSPNGATALNITKAGSKLLQAGDIAGARHALLLQLDTTTTPNHWELLNPAASSGSGLTGGFVDQVAVAASSGTGKGVWFAPFDCQMADFMLGAMTAATSGTTTMDLIAKDGATVLTTKPSIAATSNNSLAAPAAFDTGRYILSKGDRLRFDVTAIGAAIAGLIGVLSYNPYTPPTVFNPIQLFAAGERGAWWDPSDFSTMFQDTAGTVPVTAVGQTVKLLKDKSGNGNDLSSSVAPELAQDGSGYYYLQFTGASNQYLLCSGSRPLQLGYDSFISVAACKFDDASTYFRTLYARSLSGPGAGRYFQSAAVAAGNSNHDYAWGGGTSNAYSGGADTATTNRVMVGDVNRVTGSVSTILNGVQLGSNGSFTPDAGTNMNNTNRFIMGGYNDASDTGVAAPMNGRVYGLILRFLPTNDNAMRAKAQTWMGAKIGLIL